MKLQVTCHANYESAFEQAIKWMNAVVDQQLLLEAGDFTRLRTFKIISYLKLTNKNVPKGPFFGKKFPFVTNDLDVFLSPV